MSCNGEFEKENSMTLKQMRYIIAVHQYASISEAAKKLYLTQPSLTSSIHQLEHELGFTIFIRSRNGVEVTPKGLELIKQMKTILEAVDSMEEKFSGPGKDRQTLSISAQHYNFAADAFIRLIQESGSIYTFHFLETTTLEVIENTASGLSELGILYYSKNNASVIMRELKNRGLAFHLLFEAKPHVFLRAGHPLAAKNELTQDDLAPYPFLAYSQGTEASYNFLEEVVPAAGKDQVIYVQDRSTCYRLLEHTDAYSIGSGILSKESGTDQVRSMPLADCEDMHIGWIQKKDQELSALARRFLNLIHI